MKLNKKSRKLILYYVLIGIILFGLVGIKLYNDFFRNNNDKIISSIELYGYTLSNNDSEIYKENFSELKNILDETNIDYNNYAKCISKLFIIDLYSLSSKLSSSDIGGLEFVHPDLKNNFKENMSNSLYKYILSDIDGKRTQELPNVTSVTIDSVFESNYEYNSVKYDAYIVSLSWTYDKDLDYQNNIKLTLIKDNNVLYIVKGE